MSAVLPLQQPTRAPLGAIAKAFLTVSVFGFGGGIVWARRMAVEQRGWLSDAEFLDIVSLCQFLPGPNIIGIAVCTGTKLRGAPGALAAIAGFLVLPWSAGLALGVLCLRYAQAPLLRHVLGGFSAVAAGLLIATGLRLLWPHHRQPFVIGLAVLALVLMTFSRLPLPLVLVALLPLSIALSAARRL
jgi:chromate transporter